MENKELLKRWRLILGSAAEDRINQMGGAAEMSAEELLMDSALSQIYGNDTEDQGNGGKAGQGPPPS